MTLHKLQAPVHLMKGQLDLEELDEQEECDLQGMEKLLGQEPQEGDEHCNPETTEESVEKLLVQELLGQEGEEVQELLGQEGDEVVLSQVGPPMACPEL